MYVRFALPCLAGLMGAAGVALAARAAHAGNDASLMTAALFLLIHATAMIGLAALAPAGRWLAGAGLVLALGTLLFSTDLAIRHFGGSGLFAMAAPAGGVLMILGWLAVCLAALPLLRQKQP